MTLVRPAGLYFHCSAGSGCKGFLIFIFSACLEIKPDELALIRSDTNQEMIHGDWKASISKHQETTENRSL
jgi:hypothetical protein